QDVRAERALELLAIDVRELLLGMLLGSVVDEHVEAAEPVYHACDRPLAERRPSDVAGEDQAADTVRLDEPSCLARVLVLAQIGDRDVRAFLRESDGHRAADAAVTPGNERDLVAQLAAAAIFRIVELGRRPHRVLDAGLTALPLRRIDLLLRSLLHGVLPASLAR